MNVLSKVMKALHGPVYAARLHELVRRIVPQLREGDRVLDVGCGFGTLGRAIMNDRECPPGVVVSGLERVRRGDEAIEVSAYDGTVIPFQDASHDVIILADVLHHETQPDRLVRECQRVARRIVIIKDHQREGFLAQQRIAFMDWAANAPYGVPCLYRYYDVHEWRAFLDRNGLDVLTEVRTMRLYPRLVNFIFGGRLQYLVVAAPREAAGSAETRGS